jgi:hypothetical protein
MLDMSINDELSNENFCCCCWNPTLFAICIYTFSNLVWGLGAMVWAGMDFLRFEIPVAVSTKITVIWDQMQCSSVVCREDGGGCGVLRNVLTYLSNYMELHQRWS